MKGNNDTQLLQELEQLSSPQLTEMLHTELTKDKLDGDRVRAILKVLEAREEAHPITPAETAAWEKFKQDCAEDRKYTAPKPSARKRNWIISIAALAAVVCLVLFAVPSAEGSENFFDRVGRWTSNVLEFFVPAETQPVYVFQTEHPGLQEIYDAVAEAGVTQPVVPTWVPAGYELAEFTTTSTPTKIRIYAVLTEGKNAITFRINIYDTDTPRQYEITDSNTKEVDMAGTIHSISNNNFAWMAVWSRDNLECSLTVDCQEDVLYRILESIYVTEAK